MKLNAAQAQGFLKKPDQKLRALLLFGQDTSTLRSLQKQFVTTYAGPDAETDMRITQLHRDDIHKDPATLVDAMTSASFFPGPRIVLIEAATDALAGIISGALETQQQDDAFVFAIADSLPARSKLRKIFEASPVAAAAGFYDSPITRETIRDICSAAKLSVADTDVEDALFSFARSVDLSTFKSTIERLALYKLNDKGPLTTNELLDLVDEIGGGTLDHLIRALASGNAKSIPSHLSTLVAQGTNITSIAIMAQRHMMQLYSLISHPDGPRQAVNTLRPPVFGPRRDQILEQCGLWQRDSAEKALKELTRLDLKLRSSPNVPAQSLLERALIRAALYTARQNR